MFFWHAGATIAIARYVFRDDRMDLRMLVLGALLPDLIDTPIGLVFYEQFASVRLVSHGLLLAAAVMVGVVLSTRRGRPRKLWMPVAIGLLLHIVLDAMWLDPETLWWPFFGWEFTAAGPISAGDYVASIAGDWRTWATEVAGFAYLAYLFRAGKMSDQEARRRFLARGRIDVPIERGNGEVNC